MAPLGGSGWHYKFRDPDGHPLELIDQLGFTVAARQTSRGPEQDRLDDLTDTIVAVVALQPTIATPHRELLAYHSPPVSPALPRSAHDIAATRLVLAVDALTSPGVTLGDGTQAALISDPDGHLLLLVTF